MVVDWVPPEPPHASLHWHICQRLSYVPSVPQQNMLIIASGSQDVLPMGAALDAAHAHGVSVGKGGQPSTCESLKMRARRGHAQAFSDPGARYLLLVKTGVPSILVSQPLRRQSSPPGGRQKPSSMTRMIRNLQESLGVYAFKCFYGAAG